MNLNSSSKDIGELSTDVSSQRNTKSKEAKLQKLIKQFPIVIEYGCHNIELTQKENSFNGFSFMAVKSDCKDKALHIRIM